MKSLNRIVTPLNLLAMFAAFSEASAATTLPYLDEESRKFFIGFIIIFPCALTAIWFLTVHSNGKTPNQPIHREHVTSPLPVSRVIHAGFLSTTFDLAHLSLSAGAESKDVCRTNQFEVLLIQRS